MANSITETITKEFKKITELSVPTSKSTYASTVASGETSITQMNTENKGHHYKSSEERNINDNLEEK